jgi:transporter family-2 protein
VSGLLASLLIGMLVSGQARINGELGHRIRDGTLAAGISFGTGLLVVALLVAALPGGRRGMRRIVSAVGTGGLRPWELCGGLLGALLVASQGLTVGVLGVAVFTVAIVAGQTASSLFVDRAGVGPGPATPITPARVLGACLALIAVLVAVADNFGDPGKLIYAVLPAVAGIGVSWQAAINGRVGMAAGAALPATLVNFAVGTTALAVVGLLDVSIRGLPASLPSDPVLYLGGALGVAFVAASTAVVRITGVLLLSLGLVAGQLTGALLLDLVAPTAAESLSVHQFIGTGLTLVAVVIAGASGRTGHRVRSHDRARGTLTE